MRFARQATRNDIFGLAGLVYRQLSVFAIYTGSTTSACQPARQNDAFYCPLDEGVYISRSLLDDFFLGQIGGASLKLGHRGLRGAEFLGHVSLAHSGLFAKLAQVFTHGHA